MRSGQRKMYHHRLRRSSRRKRRFEGWSWTCQVSWQLGCVQCSIHAGIFTTVTDLGWVGHVKTCSSKAAIRSSKTDKAAVKPRQRQFETDFCSQQVLEALRSSNRDGIAWQSFMRKDHQMPEELSHCFTMWRVFQERKCSVRNRDSMPESRPKNCVCH